MRKKASERLGGGMMGKAPEFLAVFLAAATLLSVCAFGWTVSRASVDPAALSAEKAKIDIAVVGQSAEPLRLGPNGGSAEGWARLRMSNGHACGDGSDPRAPLVFRLEAEIEMEGPQGDGGLLLGGMLESQAPDVSCELEDEMVSYLQRPSPADGFEGKAVWLREGGSGGLEDLDGLCCVLAPGASTELTVRFSLDGSKYSDLMELYDYSWAGLLSSREAPGAGMVFPYEISVKAKAAAAVFESKAMEAALGLGEAKWMSMGVAAAR
jgi:hypothetical protein